MVQLIRFDDTDVLCELCGEKIFERGEMWDFSRLAEDAIGMGQAMLAHLPMHEGIEIEMYLEALRAQARIQAEEPK